VFPGEECRCEFAGDLLWKRIFCPVSGILVMVGDLGGFLWGIFGGCGFWVVGA
jgi:hypothetical protein